MTAWVAVGLIGGGTAFASRLCSLSRLIGAGMIVAGGVVLAAPAFADPTLSVDFEKTWDYGQAVDNIYAAQGVSFVNVLGLSNGDGLGGLPNGDYYAGAPSLQGVAFAQLDGVTSTAAYMNVAGGVDGLLNFYFSNPTGTAVEIKAYSGLNGTGSLLGSVTLAANGTDYTTWTSTSLTFSGTALSFDLTGTAAGVAILCSLRRDLAVGERLYGYLPMGSDLDITPGRADARGVSDLAPHRAGARAGAPARPQAPRQCAKQRVERTEFIVHADAQRLERPRVVGQGAVGLPGHAVQRHQLRRRLAGADGQRAQPREPRFQ